MRKWKTAASKGQQLHLRRIQAQGIHFGGGSAATATTSSTSSVSNYSGNGNVKTGATGYLNCTASVGGTYGGGGGAALCFSTMEDDSSSDAYSMNATSGAGASGLVILRWRYKT